MKQDNDPLHNISRLRHIRDEPAETDLEDVLAEFMLLAKAGKLRNIAIAAIDTDGFSLTKFKSLLRPDDRPAAVPLLGSVEYLKGCIWRWIDQG